MATHYQDHQKVLDRLDAVFRDPCQYEVFDSRPLELAACEIIEKLKPIIAASDLCAHERECVMPGNTQPPGLEIPPRKKKSAKTNPIGPKTMS